ncbi:MAG: GGDEF domain-containing protein [Candidatus Omnitrophota bacterium]|nr:GGDEF domain-containing protein [Candidatus Omnitrophota bacterium]
MPKIVRILSITAFIILILALVPWITDYAEMGRWPERPIEFFNEITTSCITLLLGALIIFLIYEHHKNVENLLATDPLTRVYNMRFFSDKLRWVFVASRRTKIGSTLLFIDVDGFKKYNDIYGHMEGNKLLELMGGILLRGTRRFIDWPFRIGGDEFAVLMEFSDKKSAGALARRLKNSFDKETHRKAALTIGISEIDDSMSDEREWIKKADAEMYRMKKMRGISRMDNLISKLPK